MLKNDNKYPYQVIFNNLTCENNLNQSESSENGLKSTSTSKITPIPVSDDLEGPPSLRVLLPSAASIMRSIVPPIICGTIFIVDLHGHGGDQQDAAGNGNILGKMGNVEREAAAYIGARLAELGASENEIMAVTGHTTSKEVVRYTRSARQKVVAASAMARFGESKN